MFNLSQDKTDFFWCNLYYISERAVNTQKYLVHKRR